MIIQHNIMALNAHRQLSGNTSLVSKNIEKLSSGFKINRAGDDASGLAISEKMRAQIKGLQVAQQNAQDGISLIQTAEGALTEVHSMLNRMVELAEKSANGTVQNEVDRSAIQKEVQDLLGEIDRIAQSTNFNGINLLNGNTKIEAKQELGQTVNTAAKLVVNMQDIASAASGKVTIAGEEYDIDTDPDIANGVDAINKFLADTSLDWEGVYNEDTKTLTLVAKTAGAAVVEPDFEVDGISLDPTDVEFTGGLTGAEADVYTFDFGKAVAEGSTFTIAGKTIAAGAGGIDDLRKTLYTELPDYNVTTDGNKLVFTKLASSSAEALTEAEFDSSEPNPDFSLTLQIGDSDHGYQKVDVKIDDLSSVGLALNGLKVDTQDEAAASIAKIKAAINKVSTNRGNLGGLQNRLEHTINNLSVTEENMTAAESRIRDVDMAKEMMAFTKNNVLTQAAQAMLAQANTQPQSVLQLLQ